MIAVVEVDVALTRPPRADRTLRIVVGVDVVELAVAAAEREAELTACLIATSTPGVVMPVASRIVELVEL